MNWKYPLKKYSLIKYSVLNIDAEISDLRKFKTNRTLIKLLNNKNVPKMIKMVAKNCEIDKIVNC